MSDLTGKTAIVTGAAGDIGAAAVRLFLERGARVAAVDRDAAGLARLAESRHGAQLLTIEADVSHEAQVEAYMEAALGAFGGLDIVFNNAGIEGGAEGTWKLTQDFPAGEFERILAVNVTGVFLGMKHSLPHLVARGGGAIVNTSSIYGVQGAPGQIGYVASKHAVIGMTKTVAAEAGPQGVRVNCIGPAVIRGQMMDRLIAATQANRPPPTSGAQRDTGFVHPLNRWCEPAEVAQLVAFLVSDEARFITGAYYAIDGGLGAT